MSRCSHPLAAPLLGLLLLLWGPCPGLWANTVEGWALAGEAPATSCRCDCGGCEEDAPDPEDDCPFCSLHGGRAEVVLAESAPPLGPDVSQAGLVDETDLQPAGIRARRAPPVEILRPPRDGPRTGVVQLV